MAYPTHSPCGVLRAGFHEQSTRKEEGPMDGLPLSAFFVRKTGLFFFSPSQLFPNKLWLPKKNKKKNIP
jgi:hypothetical protein